MGQLTSVPLEAMLPTEELLGEKVRNVPLSSSDERATLKLLCITMTHDPLGFTKETSLLQLFKMGHTWKAAVHVASDSDASWPPILARHPHCRQWGLTVRTVVSLYGNSSLEVLVGSDRNGRSTFCSCPDGFSLAQESVDLNFFCGQFEIPLWILSSTLSLRQALAFLTRTNLNKALKSDGKSYQFSLVGNLDGASGAGNVPNLQLRVHWVKDSVWQSRDLPFSGGPSCSKDVELRKRKSTPADTHETNGTNISQIALSNLSDVQHSVIVDIDEVDLGDQFWMNWPCMDHEGDLDEPGTPESSLL